MGQDASDIPSADVAPAGRLVYVLEAHHRTAGTDVARLRQFLRALLGGKWVILTCTFLLVALVMIYYFNATRWYKAEVTLLPAESKSSTGLVGQVSSLTGALGIRSLVNTGTKPEPLAVLRSRDFIGAFIDGHKLGPVLQQHMPRSLFGGKKSPTDQEVITYFLKKVYSVSEDRRNGLVNLDVSWTDPVLAAEWGNALALQVNARMRADALAGAESNVKFLREELAATSQVLIQQAIGKLIQDQLENVLLARGNVEFSFRVIDRAFPPLSPASPQLLRLLFVALVTGFILSAAVVLYRSKLLFHLD
jgi:uncharacterized protein involved in exopolysaccharide biosynthesis